MITDTLTLRCTGGRTDSWTNATFARSQILTDAYQSKHPACGGGFPNNCDSYADTYLVGLGSNQGFDSLLEETVQYVNSIATAYAFEDTYDRNGGSSQRDGILNFLWYVERYLLRARTMNPSVYGVLSEDPCWRNAILVVWGRAWMYLEATKDMPYLGIQDEKLIELVRDPDLLHEIQLLRDAEGC